MKMEPGKEYKIRKIIRDIIKESLILEISDEDKQMAMDKSNERVPFNQELMKQAILQGRELGISYRSKNEKYEMPVTKYRIIQPVAMGYDKNGNLIIRGFHITGQSEKVAQKTGIRSAEAEAHKDGINAWRLFKSSNLKTMWFTGRFFNEQIPGFNPNDKAMSTKIAVYNPIKAKQYQDQILSKTKQTSKKIPVDKDIEQMGYENPTIQEKNIKNLFK